MNKFLYSRLAVFFLALVMFAASMQLAQAAAATPQTSDEFFAEGNNFYRAKQYQNALDAYTNAIKMRQNNTAAYLMRGAAHQKTGGNDEAIADYSKAIQLNPEEYLAYYRRADIYKQLQKAELAKVDQDEFHQRFAAVAKPLNAREFYDRAIYFEDRAFFDDAIELYTQSIKLDPKLNQDSASLSAYEKRGDLYLLNEKHKEALEDFSMASDVQPNRVELYNKRGDILYEYFSNINDVYDGGFRYYSTVITRAADLTEKPEVLSHAYQNRGSIYKDKGEYEKAIADLSKAIELTPKKPTPYYFRGDAYLELNDWKNAEADLTRTLEFVPKSADVLNERAIVYINTNQWDKALTDLDQAINLDAENAFAYNNRGVAFRGKEDWNNAIENYTRAIALDPKLAEAYDNRAFAYRKLGKTTEAAADEKKKKELEASK